MATDEEIENDIKMFDEMFKNGDTAPSFGELDDKIRMMAARSLYNRRLENLQSSQQSSKLAFA
jgi:hypothetical protein